MNAKYLILTSDYQVAVDYANKNGIDITQWRWIRDKFKDPAIYREVKFMEPTHK